MSPKELIDLVSDNTNMIVGKTESVEQKSFNDSDMISESIMLHMGFKGGLAYGIPFYYIKNSDEEFTFITKVGGSDWYSATSYTRYGNITHTVLIATVKELKSYIL